MKPGPDLKTVGLAVLGGALAYIVGNYVASDYCVKKSFEPVVYELPFSVSIVVTAAHEPDMLLEVALSSLRSQSLVKCEKNDVELVLVAGDGVNLDIAEKYCDRVIVEREVRGDLPPGKLTARHIGIREARGEVIVASDADTYYPPGWLAQLLKPYVEKRNVVGTHGVCLCMNELTRVDFRTLLGWWMLCAYYGSVFPGMNSSFLKKAYYRAGGFDLGSQGTFGELWWEEEFAFKKRLERLGKVVFVPTAVAISLDYTRLKRFRGLRRTTSSAPVDRSTISALGLKYWTKVLLQ